MKGYIINEGKLILKENGNRAIGICETMGFKTQINIHINLAKLIHLNNVRNIIEGCAYCIFCCLPISVGPFVIWYDNGEVRMTDQYDAPSGKNLN